MFRSLGRIFSNNVKPYTFPNHWMDPILSNLLEKSAEVVPKDLESLEEEEFEVIKKTPSDSYMSIVLDLANLKECRTSLLKSNHVTLRVGRMLEDLEAFSVQVAYEHSDGLSSNRPVSILCAFMNRIESPVFEGKCVWTGRSSMKIWANMKQEGSDGEKDKEVGTFFTMVARDIIRNKGVDVHECVPSSKEEKTLHSNCQDNDGLHKLMLNLLDIFRVRQGEYDEVERDKMKKKLKTLSKIDNGTRMRKTKYKVVKNMHPSSRNLFDKIFAGFLLKEALDIAYTDAYMFCSSVPRFVALDENAFLKPIHVGAFVQYNSHIVYSEGNAFTIRTDLYFLDAVTKVTDIINVLHTTYVSKNKVIPQIIPETMEELLMYEEGKRIQQKPENQKIISMLNEKENKDDSKISYNF